MRAFPTQRAGKAAARRAGMTLRTARSSVSMSPSGVTASHRERPTWRSRTWWRQWKFGSSKEST
eukprot:3246300-Lingulodinium_polyedra.AAC.1